MVCVPWHHWMSHADETKTVFHHSENTFGKKGWHTDRFSKVEADIYAASRLWKQILVSQSYSQLRRTKDSFTLLPRTPAQLNKVIQITIGCTWISHVSFSLSLVIKRKMLQQREEDAVPRQVSADLYRMSNKVRYSLISTLYQLKLQIYMLQMWL